MTEILSITTRGIPKSPDIETFIKERIEEIRDANSPIHECEIMIERTRFFRKSGNPFRIRLAIKNPNVPEIVVTREPSGIIMRDPLFTVLSNVFLIARRKLPEHSKHPMGNHEICPKQENGAVVSRIFPYLGYGFLQSISGREVYFHRDNVINGEFTSMEVGTRVWFIEREGEQGPWASSVQVIHSAS